MLPIPLAAYQKFFLITASGRRFKEILVFKSGRTRNQVSILVHNPYHGLASISSRAADFRYGICGNIHNNESLRLLGLQAVDGPDDRHKPGIVSFIENASCLILQYIAPPCFQGFPVPRTFQCGVHAEPLHVMLVHAVQVRRKIQKIDGLQIMVAVKSGKQHVVICFSVLRPGKMVHHIQGASF